MQSIFKCVKVAFVEGLFWPAQVFKHYSFQLQSVPNLAAQGA